MAFTALSTADIQVGKPTKKELFDLIRTNFDDHETRITANEATANNPFPIRFEVLGDYSTLTTPALGILYHRVNFDLTLTGAIIMIYEDGTAGTVSTDIQMKRGAGAFATVFSTKPSVASTGGDFSVSSNAVFSTTDIDAADILRLDISSAMTGPDIDGFELILSYTVG